MQAVGTDLIRARVVPENHPYFSLILVARGGVLQLKCLDEHISTLATAINERLTDLIIGRRVDVFMFSEAKCRKTFDGRTWTTNRHCPNLHRPDPITTKVTVVQSCAGKRLMSYGAGTAQSRLSFCQRQVLVECATTNQQCHCS